MFIGCWVSGKSTGTGGEEIYCTAFNRMMNYICVAFLSCKVVLLGKCTQETVVWHMDVHSYRD